MVPRSAGTKRSDGLASSPTSYQENKWHNGVSDARKHKSPKRSEALRAFEGVRATLTNQ